MAFQCTASSLGQVTFPVRQHGNGRHEVLVPIGFDASIPVSYYLSVHTYQTPLGTEFAFCFVWTFNETGISDYSYDSSVVNLIVPKNDRIVMTSLLHFYANAVISKSRPALFYMETFVKNLPAKALAKYLPLIDIFQALGYEVRTADTIAGKHKWVMTRNP